ncbi:MAG: hypothetical protein K2W96_12375 [Gemmataceae bacterium]|nr:hypothetical protein [Gemmataceae bacterium]
MSAAVLLLLFAEARFGIEADAKAYPQSTPKEALASVLKAIEARKFDYLVAQLAEPAFIDDRVKRVYDGKFEEQVDDTRARLDAFVVKQLARLAKEGKWKEGTSEAFVASEDAPDRAARFVKKDGRWFLRHRFDR